MDSVVADPANNRVLAESMAGESFVRRFEPASLRQLGYRTAEELNGRPDEAGSNFWKVEDMLRTGTDGFSNSLSLTNLRASERETLAPGQAAEVLAKFHEQNRLALDTVYETYGVDFSNAQVYESTRPMDAGHQVRCTVYPITGSNFYFTELTIDRLDAPRAPGQPPEYLEAYINNGHPQLTYEIGENWRPADSPSNGG